MTLFIISRYGVMGFLVPVKAGKKLVNEAFSFIFYILLEPTSRVQNSFDDFFNC